MPSDNLHTEKEWLGCIAAGDEHAFEQLFAEMHTALCFLAVRLLNNEELARDLVADIFLQLWENKKNLENVQNIRAFLYASTRNRCYDHLKKIKYIVDRKLSDFQQEWQAPDDEHFLQAIYDAETIRQLHVLIKTLPAECRKVVELGLEGCTTGEIAEKLGISASAVSNQKSRAVKLLKERLPPGILLLFVSLL